MLTLTAKLKPISELKSLPTFEHEYEFEGVEGNLKFTNDSITTQMLNKSSVEVKWDKKNKRLLTLDKKENYQLEWLDTLTFTDDSNRFSFKLLIDGLNVRVEPIYIKTPCELSFKDNFEVKVYNCYGTISSDKYIIYLSGVPAIYTFKSQKALTKFIGRLCRVKEVTP